MTSTIPSTNFRIAKLWTAIKNWIKSLDEEWDEITAENGRNCKDVDP